MGSLTNGVTKMLGGMVAVGVCLLAAPEIAGASTACKENGGFFNCSEPLDAHYVASSYPVPGRFKTYTEAMQAIVVKLNADSLAQATASNQPTYQAYEFRPDTCTVPAVAIGPSQTAPYPGDHYQGGVGCNTAVFSVDRATGIRSPSPYGRGDGVAVRVLCRPATWQAQSLVGQPHPQGTGVAPPWFCATQIPVEDQTCTAGNPVSPGSGAKVETATDYTGAGAHPLSFERKYNSLASATPDALTNGWSHNYAKRVIAYSMPNTAVAGTNIDLALVTSSMDKRRTFRKQPNGTWAPDTGQRDSLTELKDANGVRTGWQHKRFEDDAIENYSATGVLQSIKERNGWTTTLTYSDAATPVANYLKGSTSVPTPAAMPGLLISVKNHFGRELKFTYEAVSISGAVQARLKELLPPGAVSGSGAGLAQSPIVYGYEEAASLGSGVALKGQLTSVTWQDGTLKRYHYENTSLPNHLTGITDEAGVRVGTYAYNGSGQAISSEKAGGAEKLTFHYSGDGRTHVTDYTGPNNSATTRTYSIQVKNGVARPTAVTAPCPTCGSTQQSTLYGDGTTANGGAGANGQPIKTVAHDGTVTFYTYDAKGRETEKATFPSSFATSTTKPALASATTVISTQWHGTFNLPTKRAEPNRITAYTYNATTGNLTGQSETQTSDATGAAKFTAVQTPNTPVKSTGWSYNSQQLPSTIVEREMAWGASAAVEIGRWTLTHNAKGDPTKINNVTNSKTVSLTSYDLAGRLLQSADENQVIVKFGYNVRGLSTSLIYGSQLSSLEYTQFGAIKKFKLGSGYQMEYIYDASQNIVSTTETGVLPWGSTANSTTAAPTSIANLSSLMTTTGASTAAIAAGLILPYAFVQPSVITTSGGRIVYPPWYKPSPAPDPLTETVCVPSSPPPPVPRGPSPGDSCRNFLQTCWAAASKIKSIGAYSLCIVAYAGCIIGEAGGGGTP
jgi:YD repeat-containing protein